MFELVSLHHRIGGLRARLFQLRSRLHHVDLRRHTLVIAIVGQVERSLISRHRIVQQLFLRVQPMQLEPVERLPDCRLNRMVQDRSRSLCAVSMSASMVRRTLPQMSASQVPSNGICAVAKALGLKPVLAAE